MAINLPEADNYEYASHGDENLVSNAYGYREKHQQWWLENRFHDLPDRLFWNVMYGVPITIVNWETVYGHREVLGRLIDSAFQRRKTNRYRNDMPLRRRNS